MRTDKTHRHDLARQFQEAFSFFNERLFGNTLPEVIITTQSHRGAAGFFKFESYAERRFEDSDMLEPSFRIHEIAIMPDAMWQRDDMEVLSTLVHEMCHLWQYVRGTPSRGGYHNREWARKMELVGLMPSALGRFDKRNPDLPEKEKSDMEGAATGQSMSHYIPANSQFRTSCSDLLKTGFSLRLQQEEKLALKRPKSKFRYTCPDCKTKVWAKMGVKIVCGDCQTEMECEEEE